MLTIIWIRATHLLPKFGYSLMLYIDWHYMTDRQQLSLQFKFVLFDCKCPTKWTSQDIRSHFTLL